VTRQTRSRRSYLPLALALALSVGMLAARLEAQQPAGAPRHMTLDDVVRTALERNREMEIARLDVADAGQRVREAWGNVYPQVNANTSLTRNLDVPTQFLPAIIFDSEADPGALVPVRFGADNQYFAQLRVEQTLFQAGVFIGVGAASRFQSLKTEELRGRAQQIATRARRAYFDVLLAEEALRLNANAVQRVRQLLDETRSRYRAGLVSEYDVLRLEVQLGNLEPRLRQSTSQAAAARRTLAAELGMEGGEEIRVAGSLADVRLEAEENDPANRQLVEFVGLRSPETMPVDEVLALAMQRRSDLRQLEWNRRLQQAQLRAEQGESLPRVAAFGVYSLAAQDDGRLTFYGGPDGLRAYGQQVGVQVTLPVFSGFQRTARVQQRQVALRQAEVQQRLARVQIDNQIRTLVDGAIEARERAEAQRRAVQQAQRGYEIARRQFLEGLSSQLEVTDAEGALQESAFNYAQAVHDYFIVRAHLDEAVGVVPWVDTDVAHATGRRGR
jgi:outer membrane protein